MSKREALGGLVGAVVLGIMFILVGQFVVPKIYLHLMPLQEFFHVQYLKAPDLTTQDTVHSLTVVRRLPHSVSGFVIADLLKIENGKVQKVRTQSGYRYFEADLLEARFFFDLNSPLPPGMYKYSVLIRLHLPHNVERSCGIQSNLFYVVDSP